MSDLFVNRNLIFSPLQAQGPGSGPAANPWACRRERIRSRC